MTSTAPPIALPPTRSERWLLAGITVLALVASFLIAKDRLTWCLEVIWAMVGLALVAWQWSRFPLTRLLCWLLLLHALVLIHGGAYTYSLTPGGFWLQDVLGTQRNPWDRLGHWMQGFVPAILARELLLRLTPLRRGGWLVYLVLAAALSFSAFFELIEWWAALIYGADADAFLATQYVVGSALFLLGGAFNFVRARLVDRGSAARSDHGHAQTM